MHLDQSEVRRNRQKHTLELRKQNRQEIFLKRRNVNLQKGMTNELEETNENNRIVVIDERYRDTIQQAINRVYAKQQLQAMVAQLPNPNPTIRHQAVIGVRKIISAQQNHQIVQQVLDRGALINVLALLKQKEFPHIRFEASWIVSNIAAGTSAHCQAIVDKGGVEILLELLDESHFRLNEQAIWAIGNIGGDSIKLRDFILQKNGLGVLIKLAQKTTHKNIIKRAAWAISNLCRGSVLPKFELIKNAIPTLAKIIMSQILDDEELSDCLWAISGHTSEGMKSKLQKIVEINNFVPYLIHLCMNATKIQVLAPALRICGNVSIGNQLHTEQLLKGGVLNLLAQLYKHEKKTIRKEACWMTSNLCAGTASQVRQVLARSDLIQKIGVMFWSDELDVKKEICYIFKNLGRMGEKKAVLEVYLNLNVTQGVMSVIQQDIDPQAIDIGLKCLFDMLTVGANAHEGAQNIILKQLKNIPGGLERLESLQHHKLPEIYRDVVNIFQSFFDLEESMM